MDNQRKKNITTYIVILIGFAVFSFTMLMNKKEKEVPETPTKQEETQNLNEEIKEEDLEASEEEEGSIYEKECKETVKEFISIYHLRDTDDPVAKFEEKGHEVITSAYYDEIKEVVISESTMPQNGYIYRTVEKLNIYGYDFNEEEKEVTLNAKVNSNWLDENKNIVHKNELTEYTFLLTNVMGKWKISLFSNKII